MKRRLQLAPRLRRRMSRSPRPYLFGEPRDFNEALQHFQAAEALAAQ